MRKSRTKDEINDNIVKSRESKFKLIEQENFKGSQEKLEYMQRLERSYREGKPEVSDEEWDLLVKETNYKESLDEIISPDGRSWVKLAAPLGSLNKITSLESLEKFINQFPDNTILKIEPKLDGLTFNAVYRKNINGDYLLDKITSRGDGINGLAINENALLGVKIDLPRIIRRDSVNILENFIKNDKIEIRGEAVIKKSNYEGNIVPRSIVAGIFNRKIPMNLDGFIQYYFKETNKIHDELSKEDLKILKKYGLPIHTHDFFIFNHQLYYKKDGEAHKYHLTKSIKTPLNNKEEVDFVVFSIADKYGNNISDSKDLNKLHLLGFNTINKNQILKDFSHHAEKESAFFEFVEIIDKMYGTFQFKRNYRLTRYKNELDYAIDGLVIKPLGSNTESQNMKPYKKGDKIIVPKYPKDQVAIKLQTDPVKTKILKINHITTKLGNKTCSADIEPTTVEGGAVVSKVNLHNPNWLSLPQNNWIQEGVECGLIMAMDIIPTLIKEVE